jgi:hypothetical protein
MSRSIVAQGAFTSIERCDCGSVYLTVGPVCLKLHPDVLWDLRATLTRAIPTFERDRHSMKFLESLPDEATTRDRREGEEGDDDGGSSGNTASSASPANSDGRDHTSDPN